MASASNGLAAISTDANLYTKNATSVDVTLARALKPMGYKTEYRVMLEKQGPLGVFLPAQTFTGSYNEFVVKKFPLKGKPAGNYRITCFFTCYTPGTGSSGQKTTLSTDLFKVER